MDRRVATLADVERIENMLSAAFTVGRRHLVAYPVEYHGDIVTAIGWQRNPDEVVPLCLVLDPGEWADIPQVSHDHYVTKSRT